MGAGGPAARGWPSWPGWTARTITAWSRRSTQLREWAASNLTVVEATAARSGCRRRSWRPRKKPPARPNPRSCLGELACAVARGCAGVGAGPRRATRGASSAGSRGRRRGGAGAPRRVDGARLAATAAARIDKAAFTRADLVEIIGAQLPVMPTTLAWPRRRVARRLAGDAVMPRQVIEECVDEVAMRLTAPRVAHQREGHERFTLDRILAEEGRVLDLVDATEPAQRVLGPRDDTPEALGLSDAAARRGERDRGQLALAGAAAVRAGGRGQDHLDARPARRRAPPRRGTVLVLAPTGQGRRRRRRAKAPATRATPSPKPCTLLADERLTLGPGDVVVVDEAGMVGTDDLRGSAHRHHHARASRPSWSATRISWRR